ncbi:unnamed protein product [Paramecium pentaurelia]|uniref:Endoplasmic reticulum-Golgi intermediate compartment protein n=1 Tax=Paramecium pentaurelia TaxID=43138 RepID=A0A8S1VN23_9CILI|nr:unnamed protein product [Paramecium pentaurelia]
MLKFDLYRKLPQDLIEPSKSGALISFTSLILMFILFITEFQEYLTQQVQTEMYIDQNKDDTLLVNMDISFPKMPCDFITIDQQDVIGTHQQNVQGELYKKRILNGKVIESYLSTNESLNLEKAQQAYEQKEGCDLSGYIIISRVPGNFHISAHPYGGQVNIVLPFVGLSTIDLSHSIRHLSFGNQNDIQKIREKFQQGLLNPLDGISRIKTQELQNVGVTHQYYISIVPTIYVDIDNKEYFVNQFTANTNEAQTTSMPAIYFRYDISPVTVQFTKYYETFNHFIVQLCAILGGVFTIAGIIDSIFYALQKTKVVLDQ